MVSTKTHPDRVQTYPVTYYVTVLGRSIRFLVNPLGWKSMVEGPFSFRDNMGAIVFQHLSESTIKKHSQVLYVFLKRKKLLFVLCFIVKMNFKDLGVCKCTVCLANRNLYMCGPCFCDQDYSYYGPL